MEIELRKCFKNIPESEIIEDLIRVSRKTGNESPTIDEYQRYGKYHYCTVRKRFPHWHLALEKAGLKILRAPRNSRFISEEALFENLNDVWVKLEKQPTYREVKYPLSKYHSITYQTRFGSWTNALEKFIGYKKLQLSGKGVISLPQKNNRIKDKRVVPHHMRHNVFLRDGFRCVCCGRSPLTERGVKLHCDHINPWSKGGRTVMKNLRTLCAECNLGKGARFGMK